VVSIKDVLCTGRGLLQHSHSPRSCSGNDLSLHSEDTLGSNLRYSLTLPNRGFFGLPQANSELRPVRVAARSKA
jgi:hypothetical protein